MVVPCVCYSGRLESVVKTSCFMSCLVRNNCFVSNRWCFMTGLAVCICSFTPGNVSNIYMLPCLGYSLNMEVNQPIFNVTIGVSTKIRILRNSQQYSLHTAFSANFNTYCGAGHRFHLRFWMCRVNHFSLYPKMAGTRRLYQFHESDLKNTIHFDKCRCDEREKGLTESMSLVQCEKHV